MNLIIVIPTYNERDNIQPLAEEILKIVPKAKILIVDDNSPDGTGGVADALAKKYPQINVLHRQKKGGLGRAYIAGFKEALKLNPDYIMQMDADFSHHPKYIPRFLEAIQNSDLVIGSRFIDKITSPANVSALSVWANRYAKWVLNLKVNDCLGGFKCFRKSVLEKIGLAKFISREFVFQTEFIYRAYREKFVIKEIPIIFYARNSGTTKKNKRIILEAFLKVILLRLVYIYRILAPKRSANTA